VPYCGETPLHNAMAYGSKEMIQMLLDAGADAGIRTRHGETPFIGQDATRNSAPYKSCVGCEPCK
jgi:ankyrin repeat protein